MLLAGLRSAKTNCGFTTSQIQSDFPVQEKSSNHLDRILRNHHVVPAKLPWYRRCASHTITSHKPKKTHGSSNKKKKHGLQGVHVGTSRKRRPAADFFGGAPFHLSPLGDELPSWRLEASTPSNPSIHLAVDSFPILSLLFNHRSVRKPDLFPWVSDGFPKRNSDPWKEWKWKVPLECRVAAFGKTPAEHLPHVGLSIAYLAPSPGYTNQNGFSSIVRQPRFISSIYIIF